MVYGAEISEDKLQLLTEIITICLDIIKAVKQFNTDDPPWITAEFKALIKRRQKAFAKGDTERFRHLRNAVNRERKSLRGKSYASKVNNLKDLKPSQWWSAVKHISRLISGWAPKACYPICNLQGLENNSCNPELANVINAAFLWSASDPLMKRHASLMSSHPFWSPSLQF